MTPSSVHTFHGTPESITSTDYNDFTAVCFEYKDGFEQTSRIDLYIRSEDYKKFSDMIQELAKELAEHAGA